VKSLLAARALSAPEVTKLDYQIQARWHLGVVAMNVSTDAILGRLGRVTDAPLCVELDSTMWIWCGSRRRSAVTAVEDLSEYASLGSLLAVGEPGYGFEGWRLTHHQAQAALEVALHMPERFARYTEHRLLAAALQNETLAKSLEQTYLRLFDSQRDGGSKLRETLRAHIDAGCIASSTAAVLRVDRHTVEDRVRTAERLLGRSLRGCLAELDVALRVGELNGSLVADEQASER
jgi:sugar diacid utilization regulator